MSDVFEGGSVFPKVITYYDMVSKYPESMMKKTMKKTCPDEGLRCSFCGKLSLALTDVHDYQRSADMRVCESCARNMLESVMAEKERADPAPPPALDFNRENAPVVLSAAAHALATAARVECEQLVGDVVFGGGTLAQRRVGERFETIQLYWYQRAVLASIASEACAEKYDDVPHLVSYANDSSDAKFHARIDIWRQAPSWATVTAMPSFFNMVIPALLSVDTTATSTNTFESTTAFIPSMSTTLRNLPDVDYLSDGTPYRLNRAMRRARAAKARKATKNKVTRKS